MKLFMLFFVLLLFIGCHTKEATPLKEFKRVALVIGNEGYANNALSNPINDAIGVKETLEKIGFEVSLKTDVNLSEFYQALDEFKTKIIPKETIVFFYFAGHGNTIESNSEEYLMMTDQKEKVLVSIYRLYEFLNDAEARHNIVVIDACRNYQQKYLPTTQAKNDDYLRSARNARNFRGNFRANISEAKGKVKDEFVILDHNCSSYFPKSTIVSYATMHNQMAKDWSEYEMEHSPYTRQLMKHLDDEEIPIEEVFRRVRIGLIGETNRTQINLEENSLEKNVWLVPKKGQVAFAPPI
ncbi:MAG: caspase family protein [Epsilonproteobacteria bacterium]|nr:caspase family protein [Campylobacterota bacterium]